MSLTSAICRKAIFECINWNVNLLIDPFRMLAKCLFFGKCTRGIFDDVSHLSGQVACEAAKACSGDDLPSFGDFLTEYGPTILTGFVIAGTAVVIAETCRESHRPRHRRP